MNKKDRIKYWRKELLKNGEIPFECYREPDKEYPPYRKGSYFLQFVSKDVVIACGDKTKYKCYQFVYNELNAEKRRMNDA